MFSYLENDLVHTFLPIIPQHKPWQQGQSLGAEHRALQK